MKEHMIWKQFFVFTWVIFCHVLKFDSLKQVLQKHIKDLQWNKNLFTAQCDHNI